MSEVSQSAGDLSDIFTAEELAEMENSINRDGSDVGDMSTTDNDVRTQRALDLEIYQYVIGDFTDRSYMPNYVVVNQNKVPSVWKIDCEPLLLNEQNYGGDDNQCRAVMPSDKKGAYIRCQGRKKDQNKHVCISHFAVYTFWFKCRNKANNKHFCDKVLRLIPKHPHELNPQKNEEGWEKVLQKTMEKILTWRMQQSKNDSDSDDDSDNNSDDIFDAINSAKRKVETAYKDHEWKDFSNTSTDYMGTLRSNNTNLNERSKQRAMSTDTKAFEEPNDDNNKMSVEPFKSQHTRIDELSKQKEKSTDVTTAVSKLLSLIQKIEREPYDIEAIGTAYNNLDTASVKKLKDENVTIDTLKTSEPATQIELIRKVIHGIVVDNHSKPQVITQPEKVDYKQIGEVKPQSEKFALQKHEKRTEQLQTLLQTLKKRANMNKR